VSQRGGLGLDRVSSRREKWNFEIRERNDVWKARAIGIYFKKRVSTKGAERNFWREAKMNSANGKKAKMTDCKNHDGPRRRKENKELMTLRPREEKVEMKKRGEKPFVREVNR